MTDLPRVALFAQLDEEGTQRVGSRLRERHAAAGEVLLRRGEEGRALYIVRSGGVRVDPPGSAPVHLGPHEVFGELSLLTGAPVSARVTATGETVLDVLDRVAFLELHDALPELRAATAGLLVERLRRREALESARGAERVRLELPAEAPAGVDEALRRLVTHYEPTARWLDTRTGAAAGELEGLCVLVSDPQAGDPACDALVRWHAGAVGSGAGAAPHELDVRTPDVPLDREGPWRLVVDPAEVALVLGADAWGPELARRAPGLDRVARWITRRWVGVALGAGAALGFAHHGVLAELETAGVPVDAVSGSSMGGIAAILSEVAGSAERGIEVARVATGSNRIARRPVWFPRASFLSSRPVRRAAVRAAGTRTFADLARPLSVVASDLVRGARVVIDRGSLVEAMLATGAVPGAFPPVPRGEHLLVDGGLLSRLPVDLLASRRCGVRIAVNVIAAPDPGRAAPLARRIHRFLGFRAALGAAWDLAGWWQGASEAAEADVLIEPDTRGLSGFDFDVFDEVVALGRDAARSAMPAVLHRIESLGML